MRRLMYVLLTAVLIGCGSQAAPHATAANAVQRPAPEPLPLPGSEPETSAAADPAARQQAEPALPMPLLVPERPERRAEPAPRPAEDEVLEPTGTLPQGWESGYLRRGPFVYGIFNQERKAFLLLLPVMPAAPGETALQAATLQAAEFNANTAGDAKAGEAKPLTGSNCAVADVTIKPQDGTPPRDGLMSACIVGDKKQYLAFFYAAWNKNDAAVRPDIESILRSFNLVKSEPETPPPSKPSTAPKTRPSGTRT